MKTLFLVLIWSYLVAEILAVATSPGYEGKPGSARMYKSPASLALWETLKASGFAKDRNVSDEVNPALRGGDDGGARAAPGDKPIRAIHDTEGAYFKSVLEGEVELNETERRRILNIYDDNPRVEVDESLFPARVVGVLSTGCTGTMISRNVLLTAAHCLDEDKPMVFFAGFSNGAYVAVGQVEYYIYNTAYDFALLELGTYVGDVVGWFGVDWYNIASFSTTRGLNAFSYSGDHCDGYEGKGTCKAMYSSCTSRGVIDASTTTPSFRHSCSVTSGASGSAMYQFRDNARYVVGYHWGSQRVGNAIRYPTYSDAAPGLGRPAANFYNAFTALGARQDSNVPLCAPLCPRTFRGDRQCDWMCNNAACGYDGGDCTKAPTRMPTRFPTSPPTECNVGCRPSWIGDKECDAACNVAACRFDAGDCVTAVPTTPPPTSKAPTKLPTSFPTTTLPISTPFPTAPTASSETGNNDAVNTGGSSSSSSDLGLIIGVSVGCFVGLVLLVAGGVWYYKKGPSANQSTNEESRMAQV